MCAIWYSKNITEATDCQQFIFQLFLIIICKKKIPMTKAGQSICFVRWRILHELLKLNGIKWTAKLTCFFLVIWNNLFLVGLLAMRLTKQKKKKEYDERKKGKFWSMNYLAVPWKSYWKEVFEWCANRHGQIHCVSFFSARFNFCLICMKPFPVDIDRSLDTNQIKGTKQKNWLNCMH